VQVARVLVVMLGLCVVAAVAVAVAVAMLLTRPSFSPDEHTTTSRVGGYPNTTTLNFTLTRAALNARGGCACLRMALPMGLSCPLLLAHALLFVCGGQALYHGILVHSILNNVVARLTLRWMFTWAINHQRM
jgi:hypothetical protein